MPTTIPDSKLIEIFLKNIGMNDFDINTFIEEHKGNLLDLIFLKILNKYAQHSSEEKIRELENRMSNIKKYGKIDDQELVMKIIYETIQTHPELAEEIRELHSEINTKLFFKLMEKADADGQEEALQYILSQLQKIEQKEKAT